MLFIMAQATTRLKHRLVLSGLVLAPSIVEHVIEAGPCAFALGMRGESSQAPQRAERDASRLGWYAIAVFSSFSFSL